MIFLEDDNIFCLLPDSTHLENSLTCCYKVLDVDHKPLVVLVYIVNSSITYRWLKLNSKLELICYRSIDIQIKRNIKSHDMPTVFQRVHFLIRAVQIGNIYSNHRDNKFEANNHDPCYTFSIPKIVRPMALLDIFAVLGRESLKKKMNNIFITIHTIL